MLYFVLQIFRWYCRRMSIELLISFYSIAHVCDGSPCLHGGACEVAMATQGGDDQWTFQCHCPAVYTGQRCEGTHSTYSFICGGSVSTDLRLLIFSI